MRKSIYLDWNVFQDLIQKRRGEGLEENLQAATRKGYLVPYSFAHMRDLSRCSNQDHIDKDMDMVSAITNNWCIGININNDLIGYQQIPPQDVFAQIRDQSTEYGNDVTSAVQFSFPTYKVDISKLSDENILKPYLIKNSSMMSPDIMTLFIGDLYNTIFDDHNIQKKFRKSLSEVVRLNDPAVLSILEMPLYKHLFSNKETIEENLEGIVNSFLSLSSKSIETVSVGEKITTIYNLLDFFPAFSEKLEKRNNINNISTDAEHVLFASESKYLVCGDNKMLEKTKLIYQKYEISTKAIGWCI